MWSSCSGSPGRRSSCELVNDWDTKVLFHSPQFILYLGSISYNHPLPSSTFCCACCHLSGSFLPPAFLLSLLLIIFPFPPTLFLLGSFHWFTTYGALGHCNLFVQTRTRNTEDIDAVSFTPGCELQQWTKPVLSLETLNKRAVSAQRHSYTKRRGLPALYPMRSASFY